MLDLRSLRYVVTLSRRLSFARAAEELGISQPALTRAVQVVEQRFGLRLFDRDRAGVSVTAQGRPMIDAAAALLADAEQIERQWDRTARGQSGLVRFGMAPMPARALLSGALLERITTVPEVINDVVVRNVEALWPLLTAGDIEFFVAAEGQVPDAVPVRAEVLGQFPRSLVVRAGHPLLDGADDESGYPVLVSGGVRMPRSFELENTTGGPRHVIEDFDALVHLTASTDAIWHVSAYAVMEEIARGMVCAIPWPKTDEASAFRMVMYSLDRRTQSSAARSFAQFFRSRIIALGKE